MARKSSPKDQASPSELVTSPVDKHFDKAMRQVEALAQTRKLPPTKKPPKKKDR